MFWKCGTYFWRIGRSATIGRATFLTYVCGTLADDVNRWAGTDLTYKLSPRPMRGRHSTCWQTHWSWSPFLCLPFSNPVFSRANFKALEVTFTSYVVSVSSIRSSVLYYPWFFKKNIKKTNENVTFKTVFSPVSSIQLSSDTIKQGKPLRAPAPTTSIRTKSTVVAKGNAI